MSVLKQIAKRIWSVELNIGIKRSLSYLHKNVNIALLSKAFIARLFATLNLDKVLPYSPFLLQIKNKKIKTSSFGYPRKLAKSWVELEKKTLSKLELAEIVLIEKQFKKLNLSRNDKVYVVDIGSGAGLKGCYFVNILKRNGVKVIKYIAVDSQHSLVNEATNLINKNTGVKTKKVVHDILKLHEIDFAFNKKYKPLFIFLGNTVETFPSYKINAALKSLTQHRLILGLRFRRKGLSGKKDVERVKKFYTSLPQFFLNRLPKWFHTYITLDHRWDEKRSLLKHRATVELPTVIRNILQLPTSFWVQIDHPTYFRTLSQIKYGLKPFYSILSYKARVDIKDIHNQMAVFILTKKINN